MTTRRRFAQRTSVSVGRSQEELRQLVLDRGATGWAIGEDGTRACVQFRMEGRVLRFRLNLQDQAELSPTFVDDQEKRRLWRSLVMAVKAKLIIAEDGIETFDEVFLANIVTPDGDTIGERIGAQIPAMLADGSPIALLGAG